MAPRLAACAEFEQTLAMWEAGVRLRQAKMVSKHQLEGEGLLQRGARARDELELRRGEDVARQANRCAGHLGGEPAGIMLLRGTHGDG